MPTHQHIQIAGSRRNTDLLVDVSSSPSRSGPAVAPWQPETRKDDFWGADWSDWKAPAPEPSPAADVPGESLLDAPIHESRHATAVDKADSQLRKLKMPSRSNVRDDDDDHSDDGVEWAGTHSPEPLVEGLRKHAPPKRLLHEHEPKLIRQNRRDTTETVDRIFAYLNDPPVRRRMVPDEDWDRMTPSALVESLLKHNNMVRYLIKENRRLVGEVRDVDKGVAAGRVTDLVWKEDEHLDIVVLIELSKEDANAKSRHELLRRLSLAKEATEELLDMNDSMIRHIQKAKQTE